MSLSAAAQDRGSTARQRLNEDLHELPWGHKLGAKKSSDCFRIGLLNPNGLPVKGTDIKNKILRDYINQTQLDSVCLSECNIHWKQLPIDQRLHERTLGWWECLHTNTAYYDTYKTSATQQAGGVSLWSIDKGAHRVMEHGRDSRGLGRWVWTRYRGKQGINLRVVTGYRPVLNKTGEQSVWNQQRSYFDDHDDDRCPREIFIDDLVLEAKQWLEAGDQLVIALDVNDDVRDTREGTFTRKMNQLGLVESISDQYGHDGPATYKNGSNPIDGIYVSRTLRGLKCGYLPFHPSFDHRLGWIEIPMIIAFGDNIPQIVKSSARRLKCEDPRIVQKYLDRLATNLDRHNLFTRAEALQSTVQFPCSPADIKEYDAMDKLRTWSILDADHHCRKLRMGEVPWSPQYQKARNCTELWRLVVKKKEGFGKVSSRYLARKAKQARITNYLRIDLPYAKARLAAAYRAEKSLKKKAESDRSTWIESLCEARAAVGNTSKEQELKNRMTREKQRKDARIIQRVNGNMRSGSLTSVVAPNNEGDWVEVTKKEEMEKALLQENCRRFNQAKETPFLQQPLLDLVGPLGTGPAAAAILKGEFVVPPGVDHWAAKLIPHLKRPDAVARAERRTPQVSVDKHCQGWKRAKEQTSSGKSGITFGHLKAGAMCPEIAEFEAQMADIPYKSGMSPARWNKALNVMLEKKKGNFRVDKLRAIVLFEADFNQNNKQLGRETMFTAEDLKLIAQEQYGSRKYFSAIDHSLNKLLTFDLIRQFKREAALCANDAKSCYDRIVHSIASLCLQRVGAPIEPIVCMFTTIQRLEHHIRTVYGDSEVSFTGALWTVPIQGVGQGNGAGPQIWAVVSTPVLNMLRAEGFGAFFKAAISHDKLSFVGYAFVDDTDLVTTSKHDEESDYNEVAEMMQNALNGWEGGIRATGGAIVPEKTHWYLIDFVWTQGTWRYATIEETPATLYVKDCDGIVKSLTRLPVEDAQRTLGVRLAPDGNNKAQFEYMRDKVQDWADKIRTGHLPRHLTWQSLVTTILKSIQYPLPATTLSKEQCKKIMAPILRDGLSCSGIVRTIPRALVYGPKKYQGIGMSDLYTFQQVDHIERIQKFCNAKDHLTGQLIRHTVEVTKLEIGSNGPVFGHNYAQIGHLATKTWATHTWAFLSENGMRIEDDVTDFEKGRTHDTLLIESFIESGYIEDKLRRLNLCRIYLQVVFLSDIATGDGKAITEIAWKGNKDSTRRSQYNWPNQGKPSVADWNLWREALGKTFTSRGKTLRQPLGNWLINLPNWTWFFEPNEERMYHRKEDSSVVYYPKTAGLSSRRAVLRFRNPLPAAEIPPTALPATVTLQRTQINLTGYAETTIPSQEQHLPQSLAEHIATTIHKDARWAVAEFVANDNGNIIADSIRQGSCVAISDGSFKNSYGTACWSLQGDTDEGRIFGPCIVPGNKDDQSAYRSELAGLYGLVTMIEAVCHVHNIKEGKVEIGCDGIQALRYGTEDSDITPSKYPQFDLIAAIRHTMRRCPVAWNPQHVKGHQDDDKNAILDRRALINVDMDSRAKAHLATHFPRQAPIVHRIFGEQWSVWIADKKLSCNIKSAVTDHLQGTHILAYWDSKKRFGDGTTTSVDWKATEKAMKGVSLSRQHWVTKHTSGHFSSGKMMKRWKKRDTAQCPRCDQDEDAQHVWKCQGKDANVKWENSIARLKVWMRRHKTHPTVILVICEHLSAWRYDKTPPVRRTNFLGLSDIMKKQEEIGWQAFLEGTPATGWGEVQQRYFDWIGSKKTGKRWLTSVIQKMWDIAWDLWDHRCKILHNKDSSILHARQEDDIKTEFDKGTAGLLPHTKRMFSDGLLRVLQRNQQRREAWIVCVQAARARCLRKKEQRQHSYSQERESMINWLLDDVEEEDPSDDVISTAL